VANVKCSLNGFEITKNKTRQTYIQM